jgi:NAD(P)-dependent dehydrogenase (short-subunit alcohol dehydrogenase family)
MRRPELSLQGKTALITGASGGIGGSIARVFASAGAGVFLNGTVKTKLIALSDCLKKDGVPTGYKAIDIRLSGAPQELVEEMIQQMGKIDILVNAAGINRPQRSEDVTEKNWDDVMNINLKATFFACQAAAKEMTTRGGGKIINISSQAGSVALPLRAAYCSSKGGVDHLTRTLALEWARQKILVNAVAPTFVLTPFTQGMFEDKSFEHYVLDHIPLGRMAEPEEVAYAALFLASDLANMITGHILAVDGGWTIA